MVLRGVGKIAVISVLFLMLILSTSAQYSSGTGDSSDDSSSSSSSSSSGSSSGSSSSEKYSGDSSGAKFCKAKYGADYTYYDPSTKTCYTMSQVCQKEHGPEYTYYDRSTNTCSTMKQACQKKYGPDYTYYDPSTKMCYNMKEVCQKKYGPDYTYYDSLTSACYTMKQVCQKKYGADYNYDSSTKKCSTMKLDKAATSIISKSNKIKIGYASNAKSTLSDYSTNLLNEILKNTNVQGITITSTTRTAEDQARIMYDNLIGKGNNQGVEAQYKLYGNCGILVIKAFEDESKKTKDPTKIKAAMLSKMKEIGAHRVSHHALDPADYNKLNVVDIAPSVVDKQGFEAAIVKAVKEGKIINFHSPDSGDPAYHLEIPQTKLPKDFTKPCEEVRR